MNVVAQSPYLRLLQVFLLILFFGLGLARITVVPSEDTWGAQNLLILIALLLLALGTILLRPCLRWMARASFEGGQRIEGWFQRNRLELLDEADCALVRAINKGPAKAVWVPIINRSCSELTKPWVFTFADWVIGTFPTLFVEHIEYDSKGSALNGLLDTATGVTTFSDWVRDNQLPVTSNRLAADIHVIRHGPMDLMPLVGVEDRHSVALDVQEQLQQLGVAEHISNWGWEHNQFVFAPTHLRPHKNFLTLFRAIEILNRKYYMNLRLVVTASTLDQEITGVHLGDWLETRGLERQIVTVGRVSPELLAKLTRLASCVVSVSLFEASVPFMFSEATSTSTPVVLGANEVTESEFSNIPEARRLLANPYDFYEIAARIQESIQDPENYLRAQRRAHDKYFAGSDWPTQSDKYVQALDAVAFSAARSTAIERKG
jgi:glycosyltransferase involved in cell wall biosynthesis